MPLLRQAPPHRGVFRRGRCLPGDATPVAAPGDADPASTAVAWRQAMRCLAMRRRATSTRAIRLRVAWHQAMRRRAMLHWVARSAVVHRLAMGRRARGLHAGSPPGHRTRYGGTCATAGGCAVPGTAAPGYVRLAVRCRAVRHRGRWLAVRCRAVRRRGRSVAVRCRAVRRRDIQHWGTARRSAPLRRRALRRGGERLALDARWRGERLRDDAGRRVQRRCGNALRPCAGGGQACRQGGVRTPVVPGPSAGGALR